MSLIQIALLIFFSLKGAVSRDFLLLVFCMNQFPPAPEDSAGPFQIFSKTHVDIRQVKVHHRYQRHPVANFATSFASVVDTGGKLPPVPTTTAANLQLVSMTPVANIWNNIRLLRP
jgi:hypothetical protein